MLTAMLKNENKSSTKILSFLCDHGHRTWYVGPCSQESSDENGDQYIR